MKKYIKSFLIFMLVSMTLSPQIVLAEDKNIEYITIRSIGDILIHTDVYEAVATEDGFDFDYMFEPVKKYLENADITTANLEVIAAGDHLPLAGYPTFNAPSEIIDSLKHVGVDIVNNATNHTLDWGAEGAYDSIQALKARDMMYVGSYESWEDAQKPRIIEKKGAKVGFLSYARDANGNTISEDQGYLFSLIDEDIFPQEIKALADQTDITMVMFHTGEEYEYLPADYQLRTFRLARDAGANFVLGGHPHVVQPFINYNESQAGIFSHGNFISGQVDIENKLGSIIEVRYAFNKETKECKIDRLRLMPTYNAGSYSDYTGQVVPLIDGADYGLADAQAYFDDFVYRMQTYTNKVQVVEYLD
ncbi:CapA family protein [Eremococcus coleocola]|uniref:CapA family protein n=1 Tax=Eremococcus coleocola TaxID=88132 RepID=UPI0004235355|nr:CapA family protein [Eremococcus coleocola]